MTSSPKDDSSQPRTGRPTRRIAAFSILFSAWCAASFSAQVVAKPVDKMLTATPLVLKDGRIAEVSIHTIPFPDDAAAPASKVKNDLDAFSLSLATDCFLTAQVIGHVDKGEISGRETADIHRLARARADAIQASLVENGLPPSSIASVWDWRFMVQEPRATLWIFRLTAGDDCDDTPLDTQIDDQLVADSIEARETGEQLEASATSDPSTNAASSVETQWLIPAAKPKDGSVTAALPAAPSKPLPNIEDATREVASLGPDIDVDKTGSIRHANDGALEIVFATNSSYFPEGAGDKLRAFMKTLDKGKSYVLRIQTSVDGDASVSGVSSTDEAQRYNAWLAERRFKRVEAWLLKNSADRKLTIEPSLIENDGSRRVRIDPNPLG